MDIKLDKKLFLDEFNKEKTRLLSDLDFHAYLKEKNIDSKLFDGNLYLFKDIYEAQLKCRNCKGIATCSQSVDGQLPDVINNKGTLYETRLNCKYLNELNDATSFLKNYKINEIEENHKSLSFKEIDPTIESDLYKLLYIKLFNNKDTNNGIYLYGNMGVGKSYLMSSYFNDLARDGHKVSYIRVADFISYMSVYYSWKDKTEFYTNLERVKEAEYLCLDDIGAEMVNELSRDLILFPILDYRMSKGLPTYFVSNVSINALKTRYENTYNKDEIKASRLIERIKKLATPFELDGEDKRFKEK